MTARHRYSRFFPVLFLLFDLASLNTGFVLASHIRFGEFWWTESSYLTLQGILSLLWILVFFSSRLNESHREYSLVDNLNRVFTALIVNLAIVFALWFVTQPYYYSREHLFFTYLFFTGYLVLWRLIWYYAIRYYRKKGFNIRNVVLLGSGELAEYMLQYIRDNPGLGYRLVRHFDDPRVELDHFSDWMDRNPTDVIFCVMPKINENKLRDIIDYAESNLIKVKLLSQFSKIGSRNLSVQNYGTVPVLNVNAIPLDLGINRIVKRAFDIVFATGIMIFLLSWLVPLIGILIKLESKGPVFFKQFRHGKDNHPFLCWKFRTMVVNKESDTKQATKNDARITKVGAFLRKTSIDEIPQFINVFLGDMSVVGPRPHPIKLNEQFQPSIEKFWQRHAVKPGITGLAQAKGFRGETAEFSAMSGRVKLDRFYVKNWSLIFDIKIIILTVVSIVKGNENAY